MQGGGGRPTKGKMGSKVRKSFGGDMTAEQLARLDREVEDWRVELHALRFVAFNSRNQLRESRSNFVANNCLTSFKMAWFSGLLDSVGSRTATRMASCYENIRLGNFMEGIKVILAVLSQPLRGTI